jgi:hypothetical protein
MYLASVSISDATLLKCIALAQLACDELAVSIELTDGTRAAVLQHLLAVTAKKAREQVFASLKHGGVSDEESPKKIAAACELIGLTDEASILHLAKVSRTQKIPPRNSNKRNRQCRAGVWMDRGQKTVSRQEEELLQRLEAALKTYLNVPLAGRCHTRDLRLRNRM